MFFLLSIDLIESAIQQIQGQCHLKQIVKRFLFARFHFWAERMSQKLIEQNEKDIKSEACASRTTKAKVAKELQ